MSPFICLWCSGPGRVALEGENGEFRSSERLKMPFLIERTGRGAGCLEIKSSSSRLEKLSTYSKRSRFKIFDRTMGMRARSSDGHRATVRWCGVLADSKGIEDKWLGVEWDDPSRGKHSGEYKGSKLFDVTVGNSGSFIRASAAKLGVTLAELLPEYLRPRSSSLSVDHTELFSVGDCDSLPETVKEFNASNSLVSSFQFIWDLLRVAPSLKKLILTQLHFMEFVPAPQQYPLSELVLNATNVTVESAQILISAFPGLQLIDLSFCPINSLDFLLSAQTLSEIYLDGLSLADFQALSKTLGLLPNLTILSLNENGFESINTISNTFSHLATLFMKSNKLKDLFALDGISQFPVLDSLHIQRNPVQESLGEIEARLLTIARYPQLKLLNGSKITDSELYQSEIHYLQYFAAEVSQNGNSRHPRWNALVAKYGPPVVPVSAKVADLKSRVKVRFSFGDQNVEKTIPLSMKVGALAANVARLFKVQTTEIELAIETGNYEAYLQYPEQTLAEMGCADGSVIHVGRIGDHLFDEAKQARSLRLRSISEQIE
jgi:hypothetical protein